MGRLERLRRSPAIDGEQEATREQPACQKRAERFCWQREKCTLKLLTSEHSR